MSTVREAPLSGEPSEHALPSAAFSSRLLDWFDNRTGYRALLRPLRDRCLPDGPSWWFTSASCLFWLLVVQVVTGFLLMTTYSPSTTSAWASVHYIEQTAAGAFVRGLHHFASHAMIGLFGIHIVRVLVAGAFRAPRELIWVTGLFLMPLMIVWTVTGNPLSASQKGMAQIEVESNILGSTPTLGPVLKRLLLGGDEVGHLTLTHLYFLHVGLIPLLAMVLLTVHITQILRHGLASPTESPPTASIPYWPYQSVRNFTVLTAVLSVLAIIAWRVGAPLEAPADPNLPHMPRPEWYFRSLFELRRYFTGDWEFVATMVVPAIVLGALLAMPVLDRICSRSTSRNLRVSLILGLFGGWGGLTGMSYWRDWSDPEFKAAEVQAGMLASRARELADRGRIPPEGAITLLRDDFQTQGPLLFAKHCAACHSHTNEAGAGIKAESPSAPNLYRFGTTDWIAGMLDPTKITSPHYFGGTKFESGEMVGKVREMFDGLAEEAIDQLQKQLTLAARAIAAESTVKTPDADSNAAELAEQAELDSGRELLVGQLSCTDCHKFREHGELGSGPDLTGYGSKEWMLGMIGNPNDPRFYGDGRNDRMPAFASDPIHAEQNLLNPRELNLLVDWLRQAMLSP